MYIHKIYDDVEINDDNFISLNLLGSIAREKDYFKYILLHSLINDGYMMEHVYNKVKNLFKQEWASGEFKFRICKEEEKNFENAYKEINTNEVIKYCNNKIEKSNKFIDNGKNIIGIYQIYNIKNKYCYIGQAINIKNRLYQHKNELRKNKHQNKNLQNDWNKYGEESFTFNILETVNYEGVVFTKTEELWKILSFKEQEWINKINNKLYNSARPMNESEYLQQKLKTDFVYKEYLSIGSLFKSLLKNKNIKEKERFIKQTKLLLDTI